MIHGKNMKENTLIEILVICLIISVSCNIWVGFVLNERPNKELEWQSEMEGDIPWINWAEAKEWEQLLSNWHRFECVFDNEVCSLETNSYSGGDITMEIDSTPYVNISLDDRYYPIEGINNTWGFSNVPCGSSITWYLLLDRYPQHNFTITVTNDIEALKDAYVEGGTEYHFSPVTYVFEVRT